jgi:hypothetical protein
MWLCYPILIISTVCSATILSTEDIHVKIIVGILSLVNAILTAILRQMNPGATMQQHALISKRYNNLIRNIDTCLTLTEAMRPHPSVFIERIGVEIDNLADAKLEHPFLVIRMFEKQFGELDRLLFGSNVFELYKKSITTNRIVDKVKKKNVLLPLEHKSSERNEVKLTVIEPTNGHRKSLDGMVLPFVRSQLKGPFGEIKTMMSIPINLAETPIPESQNH